MKKNHSLGFVGAIVMLAATASAFPIVPGTRIQFQLTGHIQDTVEEEVRPGVYRSSTQAFRVTNRDVLEFAASGEAPAGTQLWIEPSGEYLLAIDPAGNLVTSIPFTVAALGSSFESSVIANPLRATGTILSQAQVSLPDALSPFLEFSALNGLLTEGFLRINGLIYHHYGANITQISGTGTWMHESALFSGSILGERPRTQIPTAVFTFIPEEDN